MAEKRVRRFRDNEEFSERQCYFSPIFQAKLHRILFDIIQDNLRSGKADQLKEVASFTAR